jgi:hypothetical protein
MRGAVSWAWVAAADGRMPCAMSAAGWALLGGSLLIAATPQGNLDDRPRRAPGL